MNEEVRELERLVPAAAAGDKTALQRIISIVYPQVLRYARTRLSGGRHPTPEDVAQEICGSGKALHGVRVWHCLQQSG